MKRTIISIAAAALLISVNAGAQDKSLIVEGSGPMNAINVISGEKTAVAESGASYSFAFDFSDAHIVNFTREFTVEKDLGQVDAFNKSKGDDYVRDWPKDVKNMTSVACQKMSKKLKVKYAPADEASGVKYDVVMKLAWFDLGCFVPIGSAYDGGNIAKGVLYVYEAGTKNVVASYDVNFLRGINVGYSTSGRMLQFGGAIADALKKTLK